MRALVFQPDFSHNPRNIICHCSYQRTLLSPAWGLQGCDRSGSIIIPASVIKMCVRFSFTGVCADYERACEFWPYPASRTNMPVSLMQSWRCAISPTKSQPEHVPTPRTPALSSFQLKSSVQISTRSFGMLTDLNN